MQYRLKKQNLEQQNNVIDFDQLKSELKQKIKEETQRRNVDDAKKRAVNQHVEYDQFEQMVLGANLKALKADEILKLQELHVRNYQQKNLENTFDIQTKKEQKINKEQKSEELYEYLDSFEDLKKFQKIYNSTGKKTIPLQYMNQIYQHWQNQENLEKVFGFDFDSEIFIDFIKKLFIDFENNEKLLIFIGNVSNFEMLIKVSLTQYQIRYFKRLCKEWLKKSKSEELKNKIQKFQEIYEIN